MMRFLVDAPDLLERPEEKRTVRSALLRDTVSRGPRAMEMLLGGVGLLQPNFEEDVRRVQALLNKHTHATGESLTVDEFCGSKTLSAIRAFQRKVLVMRLPDEIVSNNGITLARLQTSSVKTTLARPPVPAAPGTASSALTDADYKAAASTLGCEVAAIKAVAGQESPRGAFDAQGRPAILYERHYFSRLTRHVYDKTHKEISSPIPYGKKEEPKYGSYDSQFTKLDTAYTLDQDAALMSTSWGAFQIMGENYKDAGYASVQDFVAAMKNSVQDHLKAFVNFINANPKMKAAMQKKDWATFARLYNGPGYKANDYDTKIGDAYKQLSK